MQLIPKNYRGFSNPIKIALAVIISVLLLIFIANQIIGTNENSIVFTVQKTDLVIDLHVDGELKAMNSYVIKAPSNVWGNARIVRMAEEGSRVEEGDFLIQFDKSEFEQRLLEAKNKLETARANMANTEANIKSQMAELESSIELEKYSLEQSRLQAKRAVYESENKRKEIELNLKKAEIAYQQLLQKRRATEKINEAKLRQAELEVEQAQLQVKRARDDIEKLTITAPAEGLVVYKEVWEGDQMTKVKVGYSPWRGQPLLEIPSNNRMKINAEVDEIHISNIKEGLPAEIELDAIPDTMFTGKIDKISALAERKRRSQKNVFKVEMIIDQDDERLKPGMSAHCRIIIERMDNVLTIPIDALSYVDEKPKVCLASNKYKAIETGKSNDDMIVVKDGLKENEQILLPEKGPLSESHSVKNSKDRSPVSVINN
ncbi:MAG: efflux RND transporter periplasmic adaptor subunit [Caldithrix sp.]|nr:efflux RND transporter periplasmic adaptor subunit [Caldithrix sp.]